MEHLIKWNKSDVARLSNAVRKFNNVVEKIDDKSIEKATYKDLKEEILTRRELKRRIEKMNRLTLDTAETWKQDELKREIKLAENRLKRKLKKHLEGGEEDEDQHYYLAGELKNIRNLENLPPSFKSRKLERIEELASSDYDMYQAKGFRDWYIRSIQDYYSGFDGYDKLMKKLKSIKNPQAFYDRIKGHLNASDIYYLRYSLATQGLFNTILEAWGLEGEDETEIYG